MPAGGTVRSRVGGGSILPACFILEVYLRNVDFDSLLSSLLSLKASERENRWNKKQTGKRASQMPERDFSGPRRVTPLSPLPPPLPSYPRNSSHCLTALTAGPSLCTHFPNPFHSLFLHIQAPFSFFMIFSPAFPGLWIVFPNFLSSLGEYSWLFGNRMILCSSWSVELLIKSFIFRGKGF